MEFKYKLLRFHTMFFLLSVCFSLVFSVSLDRNTTKRMIGEERYKVLILGAGMAGISAAQTLYDAGITDFRVLEATERIGGRLLMKPFDGGVVELGGNWVHGTDCNPIWTLVQEAKLEHVDTMIAPEKGKYIVLDENGADVTPQDRHEAMEVAEACLERLKETYREKNEDFSVSTGLKECKWDPQGPAGTAIEYYHHDFDAAVPPEEISAGALLGTGNERLEEHIDSTGGRQVLISDPRGYASIISNMAKKFEHQVLNNHEVEEIVWNGADVSVVVNDINVGKRRTIKADFVLVTFSIGVLRKHVRQESMFYPTLPAPFRSSLGQMEMANYLKIFLKFAHRFWPEQYDYIFYASEKRGFYPVWQNLPGKKTDIRFPANDNILLVTVTGKEAWQLAENTQQIKDELFPVLKKVFGMPELPELKGIELKNWGMDPRFLGAYSNPAVGTKRSDFKTLSLPVGGKLFFAGEGLSQLYYGFLQGAYLTGEEQAKKIIGITQYQQSLSHLTVQRINYALRKKIPRK